MENCIVSVGLDEWVRMATLFVKLKIWFYTHFYIMHAFKIPNAVTAVFGSDPRGSESISIYAEERWAL
jgi:hypothetical protein